jgi:hypothetical protein
MEVGAGGLATGEHMIRYQLDADADEPFTVTVKLDLAWDINPIQLAGRRERLLDPTTMIKHADGSKSLEIELHPGKPVLKHIDSRALPATARKCTYLFGRYPRYT